MGLLSGSALLLLAAWANAQPASTGALPTATIANGVVIGTTTRLSHATAAVNQFLGLDYAMNPPVRFAPPQDAPKCSQPIKAMNYGKACMQTPAQPGGGILQELFSSVPPPAGQGEDCLNLNIYAPSTPPPPGGRTVMFWIYGGAYSSGFNSLPTYDGSVFAAYQDVIVVAPNYRVGFLGFPYAPDLVEKNQTNVGLMDQRFALQWVQENIHAFGGDPKKVTIFGESAGGNSVDAHVKYFVKNPPFRAAIAQSGQGVIGAGNTANTTLWSAISKNLQCSDFACVRDAKIDDVQRAILASGVGKFGPVADNITYFANALERIETGQFAHVPLMLGNNGLDLLIFTSAFDFNATKLLEKITTGFKAPTIADALAKIYNVTPGLDKTGQAYAIGKILTLIGIACPIQINTQATFKKGVQAWSYIYNTTFPNYDVKYQGYSLGAFHSSEIPLVFGTYPGGPIVHVSKNMTGPIPTNVSATAAEFSLSQYMNAAWANFAKNPAAGPGWNGVGSFDGDDVGVLGLNGGSGVTVVNGSDPSTYGYCQLVRPLIDEWQLLIDEGKPPSIAKA